MSERSEENTDIAEGGPNLPPVTDQQREFAQQALQEFEKRQFATASSHLGKLLAQRGQDPKVQHNKAIVDFYSLGQRSVEELREKLLTVRILARISTANDNLDDVDHAVIYFNEAVILFYQHQYKAALAILEKLYHYIEPIEETLARRILILLIELYLCTQQPEKALSVIVYMEKTQFGSGGRSPGGHQQDGTGKGEIGSKGVDSGWKSGDGSGSKEKDDIIEKFRPALLQMKVRSLLMMKSMKTCKRELKSLVGLQGQTTQVTFLKSHFEYLRGNYRKAAKILDSAMIGGSNSPGLSVLYNNNLGCLHFHQRKHHLGAFYFCKAIEENSRLVQELKNADKGEKGGRGHLLSSLIISQQYELLYNMGIQLLHCGKPSEAFDCLLEAVQVYQVNPLLWLRLAECCIMANRKSNEDDRMLSKRLEVIQESVGSGVHRKLILGPGLRHVPVGSGTPVFPAVTLEFGALCLRNALMLLPADPLTINNPVIEPEPVDRSKSPEIHLMQVTPANPLRPAEVQNLRCSILAASTYVALCINDPLSALRHAESLLQQPRLSGAQKYLGHLYMAEALVSLDKVSQAIDHLNFEYANDISVLPPEVKASEQERLEKGEKGDQPESTETRGALCVWYPREPEKAKAILQYNLATSHAIRGETDKALFHLKNSKNIGEPNPAQMYFLELYLHLMEGNRNLAQQIIKEHFGHTTPNRPTRPVDNNNLSA